MCIRQSICIIKYFHNVMVHGRYPHIQKNVEDRTLCRHTNITQLNMNHFFRKTTLHLEEALWTPASWSLVFSLEFFFLIGRRAGMRILGFYCMHSSLVCGSVLEFNWEAQILELFFLRTGTKLFDPQMKVLSIRKLAFLPKCVCFVSFRKKLP